MARTPPIKKYWQIETIQYWKEYHREIECWGDTLKLLYSNMENLDLFHKATAQLRNEDLILITGQNTPRKNPLCEIIKNSWAAFLAGMHKLKLLDVEEEKNRPGRPGIM